MLRSITANTFLYHFASLANVHSVTLCNIKVCVIFVASFHAIEVSIGLHLHLLPMLQRVQFTKSQDDSIPTVELSDCDLESRPAFSVLAAVSVLILPWDFDTPWDSNNIQDLEKEPGSFYTLVAEVALLLFHCHRSWKFDGGALLYLVRLNYI